MNIIKLILLVSCLSIILGCLDKKKDDPQNNVSGEKEYNVDNNAILKMPEIVYDDCRVTPLKLDTNSNLQNVMYEFEKSLPEFEEVSMHASNGEGEMGYLVLGKNKELTLCLIDWQNGYKIIGTTIIPKLKSGEEFVNFCQSSCDGYYDTFGVVKEASFGVVNTIRAWRVNKVNRTLEEINPKAVSCRGSFYTDYD